MAPLHVDNLDCDVLQKHVDEASILLGKMRTNALLCLHAAGLNMDGHVR